MLGITEKYNKFKESTYFAGGKFVIYSFGIYLAATFTVGCLGAVIGSPLLTFPLAMLISNPVVWVLMGVVLTAAYKMIVKPLFHLAKDYISKKRVPEEEKSEEKSPEQEQTVANQERPKTPDRDSGVITSEVAIDNNSFLHQTEKEKNYNYKLTTTDIRGIVEAHYGWTAHKDRKGLKNASEGVIFAYPDSTLSLEQELKEYKNKVEREGSDLVFTSILNLNGNYWVTLVIVRDSNNNQFRAYYCGSFGESPPNEILSVLQKTLGIDSSNVEISKTKQQTDTHNCEIFALENAKKVTDMLRESKSFGEIDTELSKYKPDSEQLKKKRIEFAETLKKDEQSRANTPDQRNRRNSGDSAVSSDSGVSEISSPIDVAVYEANHGSQNLINQTQAGNYHYLLQQADIVNLARVVHNLNPEVYEIIGSNDQLKKQLNRFKSKVEKNSETQKLTFIISLQNGHWVTLCVSHCNKQFSAYYYDSLNGKQYRSTFSKILQEELNMCENNIRFFEEKTQSDGSNCGIFALEAASRINQMLDKGKSLDDVDEVLLEYKPTGDELEKLRTQLAEILSNDKVNSEGMFKKVCQTEFLIQLNF